MEHLIAAAQDELRIMGNNHNRLARSSQPIDSLRYLPHMVQVKPAGRLIEKNDGALRSNRRRNRHTLFLPS